MPKQKQGSARQRRRTRPPVPVHQPGADLRHRDRRGRPPDGLGRADPALRPPQSFVAGDRPGLHVVHRGQAKTYRVTDRGGEQFLRMVGPGDFRGETAMFTTVEASEFAMAIQPSEVCSISRDDLHKLLMRNPDVALDLLEAVAWPCTSLPDSGLT